MSETSSKWQSNVYALIFHTIEPRILMIPGTEVWSLPSFQFDLRLRFGDDSLILPELQDTLGLERTNATVLRCAHIHYVDEGDHHQVDMIYIMESNNPAWVPPAEMQWIGREALESLPLTLPQQREVIATCLHEIETHSIPPLRPPWERRGWFSTAAAWIQAQLAQSGYTVVAPIEQVRIWGISCILRVPTTTGTVYFKASPVQIADESRRLPFLFANEAALTRGLAGLFPEHIPTPLAIDPARGWMLLEDFGQKLREHPVLAAWEEALQIFSRLQVASSKHVELLLATGCLDRRLDKLPGQIDLLMNDTQISSFLDKAEVEQLQAYTPLFKAMCDQLASYNIPATLVHGDLHPGNIALGQGKPVFFDWTDGCVSHPFFDAITFWEEVDRLGDTPDARSRLRDIYLEQWTAYEPMERLLEAAVLAERLGMLHQAVSYQHITANMEAPWDKSIGSGLTFWLRVLLKSMTEPELRAT